MRRSYLLIAGVAVAALTFAKAGSSDLLAPFGKAISEAKSIQTDYTFQTIRAGGPQSYTVILKKPNLARIDTPTQTIVADGKQITTYDKNEKTYFKQAQSDADVKNLFKSEELHLWAGFFDSKAYDAVRSKDLGKKSVKGGTLSAIEAAYDSKDRKVVTYLLNTDDNVARKAQIDLDKKDPERSVSMVVDTKSMSLNGEVPKDAFIFTPPADSREMTAEEINSAKWYYDIEDAKKAAQKSNKMIFVDFYATWCGPCKRLEHDCFGTEEFKQFGKKMVFCRIDVDAQQATAAHYGIEAMPTQDICDKDGNVLKQTVGYANPQEFFKFLRSATGG